MVWPSNIDSAKPRSKGRKLAASRAVKQPSTKEIVQAAATLGLSPEAADKAASPKLHWERLGSVAVKRSGTKPSTLKVLASEIMRARQRDAQAAVEPRRDKR